MLKKLTIQILDNFGYTVSQKTKEIQLPDDFNTHHTNIYEKVKENTMTSPARIYSLVEAVDYIQRNNIEGSIVECGVWKGGSMMAVCYSLLQTNFTERELYLYDTFEGMSEPTANDKSSKGEDAKQLLERNPDKDANLVWAYSSLEQVKHNIASTNYPSDKVNYVIGKVEDTIPATMPAKIAILRLDTDWYESTKHELHYLYPLLVENGVLIIDDYGHWEGAKKAVDEYFSTFKIKPYLSRIDETGRILIKQANEPA